MWGDGQETVGPDGSVFPCLLKSGGWSSSGAGNAVEEERKGPPEDTQTAWQGGGPAEGAPGPTCQALSLAALLRGTGARAAGAHGYIRAGLGRGRHGREEGGEANMRVAREVGEARQKSESPFFSPMRKPLRTRPTSRQTARAYPLCDACDRL